MRVRALRTGWLLALAFALSLPIFAAPSRTVTIVVERNGAPVADARVLKQPVPTVEIQTLAGSSVDLDVWAWVKTDDYADARPALLEAIKLRLDAEGITIPYPQMDVHLRKVD